MSKVLQCPHYFSVSGIYCACMLGKFPIDCETCDCPDKYYVETKTTINTSEL